VNTYTGERLLRRGYLSFSYI